jgi:O-antigen biosynthesis protein WbqP
LDTGFHSPSPLTPLFRHVATGNLLVVQPKIPFMVLPQNSPTSIESLLQPFWVERSSRSYAENLSVFQLSMFSQHPFTFGPRYALDVRPALPLWKRIVDVVCCVACLPLLAVLTCVFAVIAKVSARGPIFYRQDNAGYLGRHFQVYRFRTMRAALQINAPGIGAERPHSATQRATFIPGGRYLRVSGLADLPQIVNVLRGEMSIVGPRPGGDMNALASPPGLTGFWRITESDHEARAAITQWETRYSETMSFRGDLALITRTLFAGLRFRLRH